MLKLLLTLIFVVAVASAADQQDRIVGGQNATIEKYPYQVSIQVSHQHKCGGSIITKDWVITAASCVSLVSTSKIGVRAGSTFHNQGGSYHDVAEVVRHPGYGTTSLFRLLVNDIAVVRVHQHFVFDKTRKPISVFFSTPSNLIGLNSTITGWGNGYPEDLQSLNVTMISKLRCNQQYNFLGGIPNNIICGSSPLYGVDACGGDKGGPLVFQGRLVGVLSDILQCADSSYPNLYTEVAAYAVWIRQIIGV